MTLNITILTPAVIYQSADFRLTDPANGRKLTDESAKAVTLSYRDWTGFVTYTGLGKWRGKDVADHIVDWLRGKPDLSLDDVAAVLGAKGAELIEEVRSTTGGRRMRHTFVIAGFSPSEPVGVVVSNFQGAQESPRDDPDPTFVATHARLGRTAKASVIVTGFSPAVSLADRRLLQRLAREDADNGTRIRQRLEAVNERAAGESNLISSGCTVMSLRADGHGTLQINADGDRPNHVPHLMNGLDMNELLVKTLASQGVDLRNAQLVQGATARFGPSRDSTAATPRRCAFSVDLPKNCRFEVTELKAALFEIEGARAINDAGDVAGNGWLADRAAPWNPWVWRAGAFTLLGFPGIALGINERGDAAGTVQGGKPERAVLYADGEVADLMPHGFSAEGFSATRSTARAVGDDRIVIGQVRSDDESIHRPNTRAAAFHPDGTIQVALDVPSPFGSEALDRNSAGLVLVLANRRMFDPRSIVWDLNGLVWRYVGSPDASVFPIAINNDGVVLGQARNARHDGIAMICSAGGNWKRLGPADGMWPVDLNDNGDAVGYAKIEGLSRPWLFRASGELVWLPYIRDHHTQPIAINNTDQILGSATADHGTHAIVWREAG